MTERKFTPFEDNGIQEYVTRDGREAKVCVVTCDSSRERNLVIKGFVRYNDGVWVSQSWGAGGSSQWSRECDLFDVPVKHTRWINIYPEVNRRYSITCEFSSKRLADKVAGKERVACIEVTFEEGEGL
jgi:hypothetical protein